MYTYLQMVEIRVAIKKIINHPDKESLFKEMLYESAEHPVWGHELSSYEFENFRTTISNSENITLGQYLQKLLSKKNIEKDSIIYNKANIRKDYWHRLLNNKIANPSRNKLIRIGIALELTGTEINELLKKVGYAFRGDSQDCAILWFFNNKNYDLEAIDDTLTKCKLSSIYDDKELD